MPYSKRKKKRNKQTNQDALEKWLILRLGQKIYKMTSEHLVVPKSKKTELNTHTQRKEIMSKSQLIELSCAKQDN